MEHLQLDAVANSSEITIEHLARMVAQGFGHVDTRFDAVDKRLDRIEHLLIVEHRQRIEQLERQMKELKEALAL